MYPDLIKLHIGEWRPSMSGEVFPVVNPATGETIGMAAHARVADLDLALQASACGFENWKSTPAFDRSKALHKAADLLRERSDAIARLVTLEQGKPLQEAQAELGRSAEVIEWFAQEAPRIYGRQIPPRAPNLIHLALKEPVGPALALSPWNFPVNQLVRKVSAALAAGCSVIAKAPEETPASCAELVRAFLDGGVPADAVSLVFGTPSEISNHLISSPIIRKVSFTGSTVVGKELAALAGGHMKRLTMELGGHAPAIVFDDVDVNVVASLVSAAKWRNAGQVCVSPTRLLVQGSVYKSFVEAFVARAQALQVGDGMVPGTQMGPLAHSRRLDAMEAFVQDARGHGATVQCGGERLGNVGYFFQPTVLTDVPIAARVMNEEPFGPIALIQPFDSPEEAFLEANRLPYGLAAYAFTRSPERARATRAAVESGMLAINHLAFGLPETPLGGVKDSGYGQEGGADAIEAYLHVRYVTTADL
jgi:succinate-semialdehyde dehydrogenase/glutarate-semialdehyde dehydrogenase